MTYRVVTPATRLPVSLADLKAHLRVEHDDEDGLLSGYLAAAVGHVETITNRSLLNTVVEQILPCFPHRPIELRGRVQSVISIKYLDEAAAEQTVDPLTYRVNTAAEPGRVYLQPDQSWPATLWVEDAVTVRYVTGYGDTVEGVPEAIRQAILLLCGLWFEQRLPVVLGTSVSSLPFSVECLLAPYKVWCF
jgi:uncharacterized phiE125 gp8 family phage protein